ncbi:MAG: gliding motility-associated C-terminal domain-containing protein, partial [Bacteroidota bacterium]
NTINTNVLFGGDDDWLDFGDGSKPILVPETQNTLRPDLGEGIATASYAVFHTYSGFQRYVISYSEPNRNRNVANMDRSVDTRFYIETEIIVDPFLGCNNTPQLLVPPIDRACTTEAWSHNPGAFDPDGDSISYELVIPFRDRNTTVVNYKAPNDPKFYTNFGNSNEAGDGPPTFSINPITGTITWDAPGASGEYNIAFIIKEWRNIGGQWYRTGFVRRDMQIIVDDCDNERPDLIVPKDVCVEAGTTLKADIFGIDPDNDQVKIEAFSEIFNFAAALHPATYSPKPAVFQNSVPPAKLEFEWKTDCIHVKDQPYQVVFKITDKGAGGSRLATFKTWFIKVVGPKPVWNSATLNLANRSANLVWDPYLCKNAERIQVWRRVDSFPFQPDSCQTGMPEFLGYTKITELPAYTGNIAITSYVDTNGGKGLASGAKYCYRLVATFPKPKGGESYMSEEICVGPIKVDEPVITHVTIDETGVSDGKITVRWIEPFEVDQIQFPPPYRYDIYRAEGFAGNGNLTKAGSVTDPARTFTDQGLDTEVKVYNYRILAFDANNNPLDTSSTASSVRLETKSQLKKIELNWSAFVPWSNQRPVPPNKHLIYRGPEGATESQLVLIDEVDVTLAGFTYLDEGQYNNQPLEAGKIYCYRVMTRGGYGNSDPRFNEPFENFSQIICAQLGDENPPCKPEPPEPEKPQDCEAYVQELGTCSGNTFTNIIKWNRPDDACGNDISYYNIYVSSSTNGEFVLWATNIRDTVFKDENLPSFARCYKISAVDRSENESELSDAICFDNCPYYELPNVFSPNGDGCNDKFSAYHNRNIAGEGGEEGTCGSNSSISPENRAKCARFVEKVRFTVYNRWGKEVFSYESGGERTIYIDWDGRADDGSDLATGVYFYVADVTFDSVDPNKRNKTLKGWVHLVR